MLDPAFKETVMTIQTSIDKTSGSQDGFDASSIDAIRDLLAQEPKTQEPSAPDRARAEGEIPAQSAKSHPAPQANATRSSGGSGTSLRGRVLGFRPKPRQILLFAAIALVVFRPVLVIGLLLLTLMVLVGVILIVGYDTFWIRAAAIARWYARRNPEKAADLHLRLDRFAMKWDAFLDRFPEGSVDGFYLPDLGDSSDVNARHEEALE